MTVAPPERLARTGVEAYYLLTLGGILLVGGAFIHLARKGGAHR